MLSFIKDSQKCNIWASSQRLLSCSCRHVCLFVVPSLHSPTQREICIYWPPLALAGRSRINNSVFVLTVSTRPLIGCDQRRRHSQSLWTHTGLWDPISHLGVLDADGSGSEVDLFRTRARRNQRLGAVRRSDLVKPLNSTSAATQLLLCVFFQQFEVKCCWWLKICYIRRFVVSPTMSDHRNVVWLMVRLIRSPAPKTSSRESGRSRRTRRNKTQRKL